MEDGKYEGFLIHHKGSAVPVISLETLIQSACKWRQQSIGGHPDGMNFYIFLYINSKCWVPFFSFSFFFPHKWDIPLLESNECQWQHWVCLFGKEEHIFCPNLFHFWTPKRLQRIQFDVLCKKTIVFLRIFLFQAKWVWDNGGSKKGVWLILDGFYTYDAKVEYRGTTIQGSNHCTLHFCIKALFSNAKEISFEWQYCDDFVCGCNFNQWIDIGFWM